MWRPYIACDNGVRAAVAEAKRLKGEEATLYRLCLTIKTLHMLPAWLNHSDLSDRNHFSPFFLFY